MCSIAGMINCCGVYPEDNCCVETAYKMKEALRHRGPDQSGVYVTEKAALVHNRLAVIDVEKGTQPMISKSYGGEYVIVYNGELYNTKEVRDQLIAKGFSFRTDSDTEVVLKAYICWKENCVHKFNGIFAFAVWENDTERLFAARDRIGVKPFFYTVKGDRFIFASEIKGILQSPCVKAEVDTAGIAEIMLIGPGRTPGCGVFKDIEELPPACCGFFENGRFRSYKYWDVQDVPNEDTFEQTLEKTRFLVTDSIERQLVSDVPLCTFLSGGLDSSIISSVAASAYRRQGRELHTFSVEYRDNDKYFTPNKFQPDADDEYIEEMVRYLGCKHHKVVINTPQLVDSLFRAVDARDLPAFADVDGSMLLFCKEVKKHCTVALSGECADEIFGGYPWYRDKTIRETDGFPWSQSTAYRASLLKDDILSRIDPQRFVHNKYLSTVSEVKNRRIYSPLELRMREMTRLNLSWFMQTLLDRKDRMSMYSGLEVRVPFCDYRIVEYLYTVPWEFKDYKSREKGLLRKAVSDILPEKVVKRKKSPYPKTFDPAYTRAVSQLLKEVADDPSSPLLNIVKKESIEHLLTMSETVYWYGQLMADPQIMAYLLQVNYWLKKYRVSLV